MNGVALVDWAPLFELLLLAGLTVVMPLLWVAFRFRHADARARLGSVAALALFLTFDLIVFGAYTRLSDSGLGCPDWPGCYAQVGPWAASKHILEAQAALPTGPVTWAKAWIEMIHRYLAMLVGALILAMTLGTLLSKARLPQDWRWPAATLVWVLIQGAFGALTVTLKLFPLIVSLHLLGAMVLLGMLVCQHEAYLHRPMSLPPGLRLGVFAVLVLLSLQMALGAWVSTNYAVLACQGFPQCNGEWWPAADYEQAFSLVRDLGRSGDGAYISADALVGIHFVHRVGALVLGVASLALVWALWSRGGVARRYGLGLLGILGLQLASGIGNVVLGWPLAVALVHTAGAAVWTGLLVSLLFRSGQPIPKPLRPRDASMSGAEWAST